MKLQTARSKPHICLPLGYRYVMFVDKIYRITGGRRLLSCCSVAESDLGFFLHGFCYHSRLMWAAAMLMLSIQACNTALCCT